MNIGIISDGIATTTGFAHVTRHIAAEMARRGWRLFQVAGLDTPPFCDSAPYRAAGITPYFPAGATDALGLGTIGQVLEREHPDALLLVCDPGTAGQWFTTLSARKYGDIPTVYYGPVEGAPILPAYAAAFREATQAFTITQWSADQLKIGFGLDIPWVYHGVDPTVFHPARPGQRQELRRRFGWEDRFVVMYVARNAGRKGLDRLIKAAAVARESVPNLHLYLHTAPLDTRTFGGTLGGMDLGWFGHLYGTSDITDYPAITQGDRGTAQRELADRYRAADLYVSTSAVEGFGLPLVEAMASGLPVVVPADNGNQMEVCGDAPILYLGPADWGTWFNGAQLAHVAPGMVAAAITRIATESDKSGYTTARDAGIERAKAFSWGRMSRTIADAVAAVAVGEPVAVG